jgi:hypothetical protein
MLSFTGSKRGHVPRNAPPALAALSVQKHGILSQKLAAPTLQGTLIALSTIKRLFFLWRAGLIWPARQPLNSLMYPARDGYHEAFSRLNCKRFQ